MPARDEGSVAARTQAALEPLTRCFEPTSRETEIGGPRLLRKETESLPVQPGKSDGGAKTAATCEMKCDHLILSYAVKVAIGTEAQAARPSKLREPMGGEQADELSAPGIILSDSRDRIGHPERLLARYQHVAVWRHDEIEWAKFRIMLDQPICPRAIGRIEYDDPVVPFPARTNA
jgi:hypothetical protein